MRRLNIIIKTTTECNLNCSYCYEKGGDTGFRISEELTKCLISGAVNYVGQNGIVKLIWHGGEPSLLGADFFSQMTKYSSKIASKTDCRVTNIFQTNGYFLTDELIKVLFENKFKLGVSIDGPEKIHDNIRRTKSKKKTLKKIMTNISRLKEAKIKFGAIAVCSELSDNMAFDIYRYFSNNDISFKFNSHFSRETVYDSNICYRDALRYQNNLSVLFDLWIENYDSTIGVEPIESALKTIVTNSPCTCTWQKNCQENFISVTPTGKVLPCGRFPEKSEWILGDLKKRPSKKYLKALKDATFKK